LAWRDRPDFTCFQAGSETAAIAAGVKRIWQSGQYPAVPEVGPYAKKNPSPRFVKRGANSAPF
jgi:hypothetical protein